MDEHFPVPLADAQALHAWDDDVRVAIAEDEWELVATLLESAPADCEALPRYWIAKTRVLQRRGDRVAARECISEARWRFPANPFIEEMEKELAVDEAPEVPLPAPMPPHVLEPSLGLQEAYIQVVENNRQLEAVVADLRESLSSSREEVARLSVGVGPSSSTESTLSDATLAGLREGLADVRSAVERLQGALDTATRDAGHRP